MAAEALKNVQVLKDVPLSEWNDIMLAFDDALGVTCVHCHVSGSFEKDDLKPKETARAMLRMMRDLNAGPFNGRSQVTCYTCHQGGVQPKTSPPLWTKPEARPQPPSAPSAAGALPDADRVLARYRNAVGSAPLKSLRMKASIVSSTGPVIDAEIGIDPPGRFYMQAHAGGVELRQVLDEGRMWVVTPAGVVERPPSIAAGNLQMVDALVAVKFAVSEAPRKTAGVETINGRAYTILESRNARRLERLYFDGESGLLFRRYTEALSRVGSAPSEMTFEDYREVGGLKMPYLVRVRFGLGQTEYRVSEIQTNVELDPKRFAR
jgi:hypothetical protein